MSAEAWETLTASVRGVNKKRNQDWSEAKGRGTTDDPLILTVADGHGSAPHARSHIGAWSATEKVFLPLATEFARLAGAEGPDGPRSLSRLMRYARDDMPRRLVSRWQQEVLGHWERHRESGEPEPSTGQKLLLYGSTLIGAVLTPQFFAAWQLGDGELTVVESGGEVTLPLAPAEADLGDETESLCSREAWRMVRVHWAPITDEARAPRLIALTSDGLSKSFASDEGFTQFMTGLDQRLTEEGTAGVRAVLPEWLHKAAQYSGDDTTLAAGRRTGPVTGSSAAERTA
ncbi:protein phosphatase 2C domain-containing protein [Streptomyces sp. NBC_01465]|uniref:protein phosphatase 2C domain-containing protein n=1 Tax=Streptomyces sp. NBC_01465 TaxID=2903878 RepID=UPI002E34F55D|nr:protein phosphatase 2C domain-containing protein [Streptomyces sp. NBC_01465]